MQITELASKLQSLGLTDKEAKVYVASLFLGPSPVQKIAEQAGVNRATTYVILDQLAELGLISQSTEAKKTVFIAEDPEALDRLFDIQARDIENRREELKAMLPELKRSQRAETSNAPVVKFYKGIEGVKSVTAEQKRRSHTNSMTYGMVNLDEATKMFPDLTNRNPKERLKKRISSKLFYSADSATLPSDQQLLRETHRLGTDVQADINLYEESAAFMTYHGKDSVGIFIESKEIVQALRQLFELAWENQKKQ